MKATRKGGTRSYHSRKSYKSSEVMLTELAKRGYSIVGFFGPIKGRIPKRTWMTVQKN